MEDLDLSLSSTTSFDNCYYESFVKFKELAGRKYRPATI
jgi:hypothetical protein